MIRAAAYCRVSTDNSDQVNSFSSQCRYFKELIESRKDWELCDIYADEGISGTGIKKRTAFRQMMHDASLGRFDLLLTKEVSRFSRNILDTIAYTRELRSMGIGVHFLTDGINTMDPDAELRLSIMASIAQEESRRTSCRVTWGQTRQMERGIVFGRSLLGYTVRNGNIFVDESGAETVRSIFHMYAVEQRSAAEIARYLTDTGVCSGRGDMLWHTGSVIKILRNEKYVGDLVQKKTYTPDYLTHEKRVNRGEVPIIAIRDHHEPIVSRELWEKTQARLRERSRKQPRPTGGSTLYTFSGKIRCGECGAVFVSRSRQTEGGRVVRYWRCSTAVTRGAVRCRDGQEGRSGCDVGVILGDDLAREIFQQAVQGLAVDRLRIVRDISRQAEKSICGTLKEKDRINIEKVLEGILNGEIHSDSFVRAILESITVCKDRHLEVRFRYLPHMARFTIG